MSKNLRRGAVAVTALALALVVPGTATAATKAHSKPAKPAKPVHKPVPVRFTAVGQVTDLGTGSLVVTATGGTKNVRTGAPVTVVVPSTAKVTLDDARATLADLETGDDVTVVGTVVAGAFTASHVNASTPYTPMPTPSPTDTPAPAV